jgi:hypothetical protein
MKHFFISLSFLMLGYISFAQKIKITEGSLAPLANEKEINTEFTYENMSVGKFKNEADYVAKKTEEYNKKEAGRGDNWARNWVLDRKDKFEPKFNELFEQEFERKVTYASKKPAKYTLIYKTTSTEPGFNVGVMRKNAETDAEVWIVETENRNNVIAKLTVLNALGRTFGGYDFDTGGRLAECYADAGKALGRFMKKNIK